MTPFFIRNEQYNFIKKQAAILEQAQRSVHDLKVLESVTYSVHTKIEGLFPQADEEQRSLLQEVTTLATSDDFVRYAKKLEARLVVFPAITERQIEKLFPKNKKLKLPDLKALDYRFVTYLHWIDVATSKLYMVYHANGQFIGVEGKYTPTHKKGFCFLCSRYEEIVFFSAVTRKRPAQASPDYYKAIGNYVCMNGEACNANLTDVTILERFVNEVNGS